MSLTESGLLVLVGTAAIASASESLYSSLRRREVLTPRSLRTAEGWAVLFRLLCVYLLSSVSVAGLGSALILPSSASGIDPLSIMYSATVLTSLVRILQVLVARDLSDDMLLWQVGSVCVYFFLVFYDGDFRSAVVSVGLSQMVGLLPWALLSSLLFLGMGEMISAYFRDRPEHQ